MRLWSHGVVSLLLCAPLGALAGSDLAFEASLQGRAGVVTDVALDDGQAEGGFDGGSRLRLHAEWTTAPQLMLTAEVDLDGFGIFGAMPELEAIGWNAPTRGFGGSALRVEPRFLYLSYSTLVGQLRLGQQGSDWGLGLIASSGSERPGWGVRRHGDLVERAIFITRPLIWFFDGDLAEHTLLAVGGDLVYRDSNADLLAGDLAVQGVASFFYRREEGEREVGVYLAYRDQRDRADEAGLRAELSVLAADAFGAWRWRLGDAISVSVKGELAYLHGFTSRLRSDVAPDGVKVRALGWAAYPELRYQPAGLSLGMWAGYASGDRNADDDRLTRMTFNPEFRPAVVLFEEVLSRTSARSAVRARDLAHVGLPPTGSQYLASTGSVAGASFFGPQIKWRSSFAPGLEIKAGLIFARASAELADPYASFASGGTPTSLWGTPATSRDLGVELDLGARWTRELRKNLELSLEMEYGHLFPGAAFDVPGGRMAPVASTWIGAELRWRFGGEA